MTGVRRRDLFAGAAGMALLPAAAVAAPPERPVATATARDFGAVGDGVADDSVALERLFAATLAGPKARVVQIPPGRYRVTRPIRIVTADRGPGNVTHRSGILAHGARIVSEVTDGKPVIEIESRATLRFYLIDGLEIVGRGKEGHGLSITCEKRGTYFYNFCLRDAIISGCGGDGLNLKGNVFEGQVFNSYFRDNRRNGATFAHGAEDTVLSAVHVFGCVFGGNGRHGAELAEGAADVGFNGCYFLLNKRFGLSAPNGCTLLSHCGFENNHMAAPDFAHGDAGLRLMVQGTLVGCTAYSIYNQTHLLRAHVTNRLTMIGCKGSGGARAKGAGLARIGGPKRGTATLVGCHGSVRHENAVGVVELGGGDRGTRLGAKWDSSDLAWLGDYCLWVDARGQLRMKRGAPRSDDDGQKVGT
ncbi:MAG: glycosyl hydrolase family 28-related protein [Alphaproteobacteria bacterium]